MSGDMDRTHKADGPQHNLPQHACVPMRRLKGGPYFVINNQNRCFAVVSMGVLMVEEGDYLTLGYIMGEAAMNPGAPGAPQRKRR